ncbi:unnamed protein product [Cyprideis torosa]|uniref:Protein flightless-1 homolog n=1 Tax=Cyprideis torosa TaxID=163714 RepID=A0A7R8W8Z0_9CRUS|nr:unnamed protein product [Cyprideis torosa]CAG0888012.1 unnamed protein product [Cyprideis torosa]
MAATGVLPFVRGLDLSRYNFENDGSFPVSFEEMSALRWLKADRTNITDVPAAIGELRKLEHLSLKGNRLRRLHGEVSSLSCLRVLSARRNQLRASGIPSGLFSLEELTTIDLSQNDLKELPSGLPHAKALLVLDVSHNKIENIGSDVFANLTELLHLDLSDNHLESLPPQIRRLQNLKTLILSNNPLTNYQFRQLGALKSLTTLHLANTNRTLSNLPKDLVSLEHLQDLDLSENQLTRIPDGVYGLPKLKRFDLSENQLKELPTSIDLWTDLEVLDLSGNSLKALPTNICKLSKLRRLYLSYNELDFQGLPAGLGKLGSLEVFKASHNKIEMIPEGLCRCGRLRVLDLQDNCLVTLPDTIHLITDLELNLAGNPNLYVPPKPSSDPLAPNMAFYNVDFNRHARICASSANQPHPPPPPQTTQSDPIARKLRLRHRVVSVGEEPDQDQAKILKGMQKIARDKNKRRSKTEDHPEPLKPKRWSDTLERPALDYSEFFEEDVGQIPGVTIWEIEHFLPNPMDEALHGHFYEGDCYIVLQTFLDDTAQLDWNIYFWIGERATGEESAEFLSIFDGEITVIEGGRTTSGFFSVEKTVYPTRLYSLRAEGHRIRMDSTAPCKESLDSKQVMLLDAGQSLFVWVGREGKNTLKSKARLLAEKINKNERKNLSSIAHVYQGEETQEFWDALKTEFSTTSASESDDGLDEDDEEEDSSDSSEESEKTTPQPKPVAPPPAPRTPFCPRLYQVGLGMGYLELPQVELPDAQLSKDILLSKQVYILDCFSDMFVWFGKNSTRLVRAAAMKLSEELLRMLPTRPAHASIIKITEGTETQAFKSNFEGWDDVIAVDFTRPADSVRRTGADLISWAKKQEAKVDLSALFLPRFPWMAEHEAKVLLEEWTEDLDHMEAFVLEGKKFVKLPKTEWGHFYMEDSYVFTCRYWVPAPAPPAPAGDGAAPSADAAEAPAPEEETDETHCVVYFWQGRDASNMGWLTFTFDLQKKFESIFGDHLEVLQIHQQQETFKFLALFKGKYVLHRGSRVKERTSLSMVELFQIRSNGSPLCTRCIQLEIVDASQLHSHFCSGDWSLQVLSEGEEPENFFWVALGGKKEYDHDGKFLEKARLFRCSNDRGYFSVTEKCSDFCQADLADDDVMLLDSGDQLFLWIGPRSSEVELKLAYKAAQVYIQSLRAREPDCPRRLFVTLKGKESRKFWRSLSFSPGAQHGSAFRSEIRRSVVQQARAPSMALPSVLKSVVPLTSRVTYTSVRCFAAAEPTDAIQKLFVDKIREYRKKSANTADGLVDADESTKRSRDQEINRIFNMFGFKEGDDVTKLPDFKFPEPTLDPINMAPSTLAETVSLWRLLRGGSSSSLFASSSALNVRETTAPQLCSRCLPLLQHFVWSREREGRLKAFRLLKNRLCPFCRRVIRKFFLTEAEASDYLYVLETSRRESPAEQSPQGSPSLGQSSNPPAPGSQPQETGLPPLPSARGYPPLPPALGHSSLPGAGAPAGLSTSEFTLVNRSFASNYNMNDKNAAATGKLDAIFDDIAALNDTHIQSLRITHFCTAVNRCPQGVSKAIKLLVSKIQAGSEQEALVAVKLLDTCLSQCGSRFLSEVGKFRFLNELVKVVSPRYLGDKLPVSVKQAVIEMMFVWSQKHVSEPKIKEAYDMLRNTNIIPADPVPPSVSSAYAPSSSPLSPMVSPPGSTSGQDDPLISPSHSPLPGANAARVPSTPEQDFDILKQLKLKHLLQSKNPADLAEANRLIKLMVRESEEKQAKESHRMTELEKVFASVGLLREMLVRDPASSPTAEERETMAQLYGTCKGLRDTLANLAKETEETSGIAVIIEASEDLERIIRDYEALDEPAEAEVAEEEVPASATAPPEPQVSLIDLDESDAALQPSPEKTSLDPVVSSSKSDPLDFLISTAAPESPAESEPALNVLQPKKPFQPEPNASGRFPLEASPAASITGCSTAASTTACSTAASKKPFDDLASLVRQSFESVAPATVGSVHKAVVRKESKPSVNELRSLQLEKRLLQEDKDSSQSVLQSKTPSLIEEDSSSSTSTLRTTTETPRSSPQTILPPQDDASAGGEGERKEAALEVSTKPSEVVSQNGLEGLSLVDPLTSDLLKLENVEPVGSCLGLLDTPDVSLTCQPGRIPSLPSLGLLVLTCSNKNTKFALSDFLFRPAIKKSIPHRLLPPSTEELPPGKPFQPAPFLTQILAFPVTKTQTFPVAGSKFLLGFTLGDDELVSEKGSLPTSVEGFS